MRKSLYEQLFPVEAAMLERAMTNAYGPPGPLRWQRIWSLSLARRLAMTIRWAREFHYH